MSLINQMLRDLEERRADDLGRAGLQRDIRPLPELRSPRPVWPVALAVAVLGGVAVAGWALYGPGPAARSQAVVTPPPSPPPVAVTPLPPMPALPPEALLPREAEAPQPDEALRLTLALQSVPNGLAATPAAATVPPSAAVQPALAAPAPIAVAVPAVSEKPASARPVVATPGKPVAAETAADAVIEKSVSVATPRERAEADFRRAQAALAGGRAAEAADALASALRQDPTHLQARQALVRSQVDGHRLDEAESTLREGVELLPAQIGWAMNLARLQVERNDLAAAGRTLARSASFASRSADYQGFFGHVQHRLGQYREAAAAYQNAIRLAPADGRWWLGLALALEADGQGGEAREAFRKALAAGNLGPELTSLAEHRTR